MNNLTTFFCKTLSYAHTRAPTRARIYARDMLIIKKVVQGCEVVHVYES